MGARKAFPALPDTLYMCLEKVLNLTLSQFLIFKMWLIMLLCFKSVLCRNIR